MSDTSHQGPELRVGDHTRVIAGRARSASTHNVLTRDVIIEVTFVRAEHDGDLFVEGLVVGKRGALLAGAPSRSVVLARGSFTTPVRLGDTVRHPSTGHPSAVISRREDPAGVVFVEILSPSGTVEARRLVELLDLHLARPSTLPVEQPCRRQHDRGLSCLLCLEATSPLAPTCTEFSCMRPAVNLVVWSPPYGQHATTLCQADTEQRVPRLPNPRVIPLAEGTYTQLADGSGTQVATCRHCGHVIYLHLPLVGSRNPWRGGEYDETGRCIIEVEERAGTPVPHEPALIPAERHQAVSAVLCGTPYEHSLADCSTRR
jgi:hypothetical protein